MTKKTASIPDSVVLHRQACASPLDRLYAHRLHLEVIATEEAVAFLTPEGLPLGLSVSLTTLVRP